MIISVRHHSKWLTQAGEIKCPWNQLGQILKAFKENSTVRICITIGNDELTPENYQKLIDQIKRISKITENYTVEVGQIGLFERIKNEGFNVFLRFPATDWETFNTFLECGVSDIWIDGPMCFQLDAVNRAKGNIKIRINPYISSNSALSNKRKANSFFVRPEDIDKLDVDVIDFQVENQDREDTLFSIYTKREFLFGIGELFSGLPTAINNKMFDEKFAEYRKNCRQICQRPDYSCHYCDTYFAALKNAVRLLKSE